MLYGPESRRSGPTALATGAVTRTNPLVGAVGEFAGRVDTLVNEGSVDYNSLQFSGNKRFSQGYTRARVLRLLEGDR